jgi:hypothetical protein
MKKVKAAIAAFICLILPIPVTIMVIKTPEILLWVIGLAVISVMFWGLYNLWYDHFDYLDNK